MTGDGYQSDTAAQFAGNQALADFLSELSKEEKRPRKLKPPRLAASFISPSPSASGVKISYEPPNIPLGRRCRFGGISLSLSLSMAAWTVSEDVSRVR
jgi:hypothetical protein